MYICGTYIQRNITQPLKNEIMPFTAMWMELNKESQRKTSQLASQMVLMVNNRPANAGNAEDSVWEDPLE